MKTKVEPAGENEVALSVDVPGETVKRAYERTVGDLRGDFEIPGFRKGRAPRAMVISHYGEPLILEQTLENAMPQWGRDAMIDAGIYEDAVGTSDLSAEPLVDVDAEYHFSVRVQMMPTPVLGEYKGLEVPKRVAEITDEQVDAQLATLQERMATLQPIEDRPVQHGDFVVLDLETTRDGQLVADAQGKDQMFQVGGAQLLPGFEEQLIGVARGDEKTFDLVFPDDYQVDDLRGESATFKVAVKEIKTKSVPALDDGFAADVSEFDTIEALRADLRMRMEAAFTAEAERAFKSAVVDKAVDNAEVSVPIVMIDREAHRMYHELETDIRKRGITMEAYLSVIEKTKQEAEDGMRPGAERIVKRRLVLDAIAKAEEITVSDDELVAAVKHDAEVMGGDYLKLLGEIRKAGQQEQLREELRINKAIELVAEHAVPVAMTPAEEAAAEAAEAGAEADEAVVEDAADDTEPEA